MSALLRRAVSCLVIVCALAAVLSIREAFIRGPLPEARRKFSTVKTEVEDDNDIGYDDDDNNDLLSTSSGPFEGALEAEESFEVHQRESRRSQGRRLPTAKDESVHSDYPTAAASRDVPVVNLAVTSTYLSQQVRTAGSQLRHRPIEERQVQHPSYSRMPVYANQDQDYGYVITLSVPGQQGAGLRSLFSLQCAIGSHRLPMHVVQPFIVNSTVRTLPKTGKRPLSLQDFYDIAHYNRVSREQGWAEMVSWVEFVRNSRKPVIYVEAHKLNTSIACFTNVSERPVPPVVKCLSPASCKTVYSNKVKHVLPFFQSPYIARVVYVTATPRICDHKELYKAIFGPWKPSDVILIINWWGAGMYIPNPSLPDSAVCRSACHAGVQDMFRPSQQVLRHIDAYLAAHFNGVANIKVAVMLRSEWIYLARYENDLGIMQHCLNEAVDAAYTLQGGKSKEPPFVTADVGKYGSSGQRLLIPEEKLAVEATVERLIGHSMKYSEWEDSFTKVTGGITDRGYIAVLQKTIASRADCLVILGGGSFPLQGLHEYIDQHPDPSSWCIHLVCFGTRFREEYDDVLRSRSAQRVKASWKNSIAELHDTVVHH